MLWLAPQVYFFSRPIVTFHAQGRYYWTPRLHFYTATNRFGFTAYQKFNTSHCVAGITLEGNGIILNALRCLLTANKFQKLHELLGNAQATLNKTSPYVTNHVAAISRQELRTLQAAIPPEVEQLEYLQSQMATPHQTIDLDSLLHTNRALNSHEYRINWHLTALAILCALSILTILGYITKSHWYKLIPRCLDQRNASNQLGAQTRTSLEHKHIQHSAHPTTPFKRAWDKLQTATCNEKASRSAKKCNRCRLQPPLMIVSRMQYSPLQKCAPVHYKENFRHSVTYEMCPRLNIYYQCILFQVLFFYVLSIMFVTFFWWNLLC